MEIYIRNVDDIELLFNSGAIEMGRSFGHIYKTTDYAINQYGDEYHAIHELVAKKKIIMRQFDNKENIGIAQLYRPNAEKINIADASVLYCAKDTNGLVVTNNKFLLDLCRENLIECITVEDYEKQIKVSPIQKTMKSLTESK